MHRCALILALFSLSACTGLRDSAPTPESPASGAACQGTFRPIHEVQGHADASPLVGERVMVRGVVAADFQQPDRLDGFFLQAGGPDEDARTSEGLFVHVPGGEAVAVGDLVEVTGRVEEADEQTRLTEVADVTVCQRGAAPTAVALSLADAGDLEPYEGMLVSLAGELTVAGSAELGEKGRLLLATGGRPFKHSDAGARSRRLWLDDGSVVESPTPTPYLDESGTRRAGDVVSGLTGILSEDEDGYGLHPTTPPRFARGNPRPAQPPAVGGSVRVAAVNLLNFFTTLKHRGAEDEDQLGRQLAKHVKAISALDPDIVGLSELENNGEGAIRALIDALNSASTSDRWSYVADPEGGLGDDPIRVGLIYRPGTVTPVGPPRIDRDPVFKRPPFAQTFETRGERFTVVVSHLKSKSCREVLESEADAGDGQGCWNPLRVRQTRRLLEFVAQLQTETGDDDVLLVGDLNAYGGEDPIRALTDGGLTDQVAAHVPADERYSYVYKGEAGYLDHALTTASLNPRVTGAGIWHINADEPNVLSYRRADLSRPDAYRSSDHDPVLIGLDL